MQHIGKIGDRLVVKMALSAPTLAERKERLGYLYERSVITVLTFAWLIAINGLRDV